MIRKLLKINLKETNNKTHILILAIVSIMITHIKLKFLSLSPLESFYMGDVLILVFGGLNRNFNIVKDFLLYVLWITPNILTIYLIHLGIINKLKKTCYLILPRTFKKHDWIISCDAAIYIVIIKYYIVLFIFSLITIFIEIGPNAFTNINVIPNQYNQLTTSTNQYLIIIYIFILNIFTIMCIIKFMKNVYYIFHNSYNISMICMISCFIIGIAAKFDKINKFILINQGMFIRHDLFKSGFKGFSLTFSILYLSIFLIINSILGLLIIRKKDMDSL